MALRRRKPQPMRRSMEPLHKINHKIDAPEVRVVGENIEQGVYPIAKAIRLANEQDMDLVLISPKAVPPVCKVVEYKKFLYDQKKKKKELAQNAQKVVVKEIRFGPNTSDHDYDFKKKHTRKFLEDGAKVKAFVFFKGRSIVFKEQGQILLLRLAQDLEDVAKVEHMPKLEGKRMILWLAPKKNK